MASCFFLLKQFDDVNIYLSSVKAYMYNDDDFNWNYGLAQAAVGNYKEAEETLLLVMNEKYHQECVASLAATRRNRSASLLVRVRVRLCVTAPSLTQGGVLWLACARSYCYLSWLCRCYIMNKKTKLAWEQYLKMDTSNDSFNLLQLIANDCYKVRGVVIER